MSLSSKKKYARFINVGKFMWERKEARDCLAARHQSIENEKRLVETGQQKLKRFQAKACAPTCQINVYPHIQLIHKG